MSSGQIKYTNPLAPAISWTTLNSTDSRVLFYDNGGNDWSGLGVDQGGNWWLRTGTASQNVMTMMGDGRVGIGTSNPASKLDVVGNIASNGTVSATTLTGTLSTAAQPNITSVGTLGSLTVSGDVTVDTDTLVVDSTNNYVGIGTNSPAHRLDLRATGDIVRMTSTGGECDILYANTSNTDTWQAGATASGDAYYIFGSDYRFRAFRNGDFGFGTTIMPPPIGSPPLYMVRAWLNLDASGSFLIRGSGNISSVVQIATGRVQVFFQTAMPDTNYAIVGTCAQDLTSGGRFFNSPHTYFSTTDFGFTTNDPSNNLQDMDYVSIVILR